MIIKNLFSVLVGTAVAFASTVDGQRKYDQGLYKEALGLFESDFEKTKSEESFVKALQSRMMLREYENTLKKAAKPPEFREKKWEMVFKIIHAKSIERFMTTYAHQMAPTETKGEKEPIKRTYQQWQNDLQKRVKELVKGNEFLLDLKLESVKSFFYFKDVDVEAMPTVYDWVANEVVTNYNWNISSDSIRREVIERALKGGDSSRDYVRDYWRMELSKIDHPVSNYFNFDPTPNENPPDIKTNKVMIDALDALHGRMRSSRGKAESLLMQARFYGNIKDPESALKRCRQAIDLYKGKSTAECLRIISRIESKEIAFNKNRFNSKTDLTIPVRFRNLKDLFVRVYPIENKSIDQNFQALGENNYDRFTQDELKKIIDQKPLLSKKIALNTGQLYFFSEAKLALGKVEPGLYRVVLSDSEKIEAEKTFVYGAEVRVTDIQLVYQMAGDFDPEKSLATSGPQTIPTHRFFVFDNSSGQLLSDIPMRVKVREMDTTSKTDKDGSYVLGDMWHFQASQNDYSTVRGVAQIKNSVSTFANDYVQKPTYQHLKLVSEFDRPIYRPGQKVIIKAIVLKRIPFGYRVMTNTAVNIKIYNPQYQVISEKNVTTNTQGAVHWVYELPMTGMLGHYQVQFDVNSPEISSQNYPKQFSDNFNVEEYKRPDYYVELEKPTSPWVFDKEAKIKVSAKYYYGAPLKKGKLDYTITSETYYPWFYDFRGMSQPNNGQADSISKQGVLDDKGEFTISYTPKAHGADSRRYSVKVSVRDESGRAIDGSGYYLASSKEFFINAVTAKEFFKNTETPGFVVKLEAPNGAMFSAPVEYELLEVLVPNEELKNKLKKDRERPRPYYGYRGGWDDRIDFNSIFGKLSTKPLNKGSWGVEKEKSNFDIGALPEGVFKIKMTALDSAKKKVESELFFIVAENGKKLSLYYIPEITLLSKPEYKLGETASVLFGSSEYSGNMVGFLLKHQLKIDNPIFRTNHGVKVYETKVTESMFNGASFTWFSVFDDQIIQGRKMITVNNDYKKMDIRFDKTSKIKPGENSQLNIVNKSKITDVEAMVAMYDQSLELYANRNNDVHQMLYQNSEYSQEASAQIEPLSNMMLKWVHPTLKSMLELFKKNQKHQYRPVLLIDADRLRGENDYQLEAMSEASFGSVASGIGGRQMMQKSAMAAPASSMAMGGAAMEADKASPAVASERRADTKGKADPTENKEPQNVEARKDFSETAVFEPFFKAGQEKSSLSFKAPDQLTAWKTKLLAISSNGLVGHDEQVIVSQKDFFVRVLVSRFFRENDETEIRLKVDNLTATEMPTQLSLLVEGVGFDAGDLFKGQKLKHEVTIAGNDSYMHIWKLKVPALAGALKIKGTVVAGKETDAEEKMISILPSRQRLIENTLVYLKEKQNVLTVNNWNKKDATRVNELMSLQIDPQLPVLLLNSVPSLINYPYNCSEQLINKYVPLAIINSIYQKNPQLQQAMKEAFKKTGNRKTVTLPWEEKDPRRLMELTETPWIVNSKGMTSPYELISFLDADTIERVKTEVFKELKTRQNASGGFSWFSGGREDLYITLVVLEGLSEAALYGVDFPKDMYESALNYVYNELPKYLKATIGELQFLIYGAYIFTAFDTKGKNFSHNKEVVSVWLPFIEKHDPLITPLGHAYMANIYKRLGMDKKSDTSLNRALNGSKKDPLMGIYWAPEERSWMWYSDTVEKHAFFLQTLTQLKPNDDRIDGLVQWLLANRKGSEWKSTKATTKAVFSLMHYLRLKTNFTQRTQLAIDWGGRKEKIELDPLSVDQKEPLRFLKTDNFKKDDGKVTITKTGALPVFAGLTWIYSSDEMTDASSSSMMGLKREFYLVKKDTKNTLVPLKLGEKIKVGDEIEVLLTVNSRSQIDYVHLKDPRGAGFEGNSLLSGYRWESIGRYEEPRDSLMNFFFDSVPKGEYMMRHRFKATTPGIYKFNSATIQSMYAPEMTAYSSTFRIEVVDTN